MRVGFADKSEGIALLVFYQHIVYLQSCRKMILHRPHLRLRS